MKKAFIIVVIVLSIIIYNYDFEDSPADTNKSDTSSASSAQSSNKENPYLYFQYRYAEQHDIPLEDFSERDKLSDWLDTQGTFPEPTVYMRAKGSLFSDVLQFMETDSVGADYRYQGELDGEYPDGYGILCKNKNIQGHPEIVYIGNFKNGYFDGYGLLFAEPDSGEDFLFYLGEHKELLYAFLNYVKIEGNFKEGQAQGRANQFLTIPAADLATSYYENRQEDFTADDVNYAIATDKFKDGEPNGQGKIYIEGELSYEGKLEDALEDTDRE